MPAVPGEVQAAFWALVLACLTLLTLYVRGLSIGQSQHGQALASVQGAIDQVRASLAGAGGPRPLPVWDQLNDPNPDGTLPAERANECGEECCAMVISFCHGVPVEADYLRFLLGGAKRQPLTTGADLVRILALCNVKAQVLAPSTADLAHEVQRITKGGRVAIALGEWVDPTIQHWVVCVAASLNGWTVADPWGGRKYNAAWPRAQGAYAGQIVEVIQAPDG